MAARRKVTPTPSAFRQEQPEWDRQLWRATGLAIGQWILDAQINLRRPIRSLTQQELTGMSWTAISEYIKQRQHRGQDLKGRPGQLWSAESSDADT